MSEAEPIMPPVPRLTFRTILYALDLSRASLCAFRFASEIAARYAATLLITHIVPAEEQLRSEYRRAMDALDEMLSESLVESGGLEVRDIRRDILIKQGSIGPALGMGAAQHNADLIVLGTHGWTGLQKLTDGSKAEEIAHSVAIPVLTIGPRVSRGPGFKRLLLVTDFSPISANPIAHAASLAEKFGASLDVLHVNDPDSEETPREATERMAEFIRIEIRKQGFSAVIGRSDLQFGRRSERIVQFATDQNIDMIVMGQKRTSGIRARIAAHLAGGLAYDVITRAPCAVLTVPGLN